MKDWDEKKLDEELNALMDELPLQDDLEKKINQSINRRIRKIIITTVSVTLILLLLIFLVISPAMSCLYLNPYKLNKEPDKIYTKVMRDYWEISKPYMEIMDMEVTSKGFANYKVQVQVTDGKSEVQLGTPNAGFRVKRGKYTDMIEPNQLYFTHIFGRFEQPYSNKEEIVEQIEELPESAMIYLVVSDSRAKTLSELQNLPVQVDWIQVYQPNAEFQGGLQLSNRTVCMEKEDEREALSEEELKKVYLSNLKNLLDNPELWTDLGLCDGRKAWTDEVGVLEKTYQDAQKLKTLESKNYCVAGKKDNILTYLQNLEEQSIFVEDVRFTSLQTKSN